MGKSLLLDTNLLTLLVVGLTDISKIETHNRTRAYTKEDFNLLVKTIDCFQQLWISSQCIAECSNLLRQKSKPEFEKKLLSTLHKIVLEARETNINSQRIFENDLTFRLGVTDSGLFLKAKRVSKVLTSDLDLYLEIEKKYKNGINFNHLRSYT